MTSPISFGAHRTLLYRYANAQLPSLDGRAFRRIAEHMEKRAHPVWDLRPAEDEEGGYVLTRKNEERAVDLRDNSRNACLCPKRARLIRQGQVQPVLVIQLSDTGAQVQTEQGEELMVAPEMLIPEEPETSTCPMCGQPIQSEAPSCAPQSAEQKLPMSDADADMEGGQMSEKSHGMPLSSGMEPATSSSSQMAPDEDLIIVAMLREGQMDNWSVGQIVQPTREFRPIYMGGKVMLDPDERTSYEIEGFSNADPQRDRMFGIPNPELAYPNQGPGANLRVRLAPVGGGQPVYVTPTELEKFFTDMGAAPLPEKQNLLSPYLRGPRSRDESEEMAHEYTDTHGSDPTRAVTPSQPGAPAPTKVQRVSNSWLRTRGTR